MQKEVRIKYSSLGLYWSADQGGQLKRSRTFVVVIDRIIISCIIFITIIKLNKHTVFLEQRFLLQLMPGMQMAESLLAITQLEATFLEICVAWTRRFKLGFIDRCFKAQFFNYISWHTWQFFDNCIHCTFFLLPIIHRILSLVYIVIPWFYETSGPN